jgi:hypothetical protein
MSVHKKERFESQTLILDGNEYLGCELRHCNLVYKGQDAVKLEHCHIAACTWQFEDAALRTAILLKGLYQSGHMGREVVEAIFHSV